MPFIGVLDTLCHGMCSNMRKQGNQLKKIKRRGLEGVLTTRANFIFSPVWSESNSVKVGGNLGAAARDWKEGLGTSPPARRRASDPVNCQMVPRFRFSVWQVPWSWFNQLVNERRLPETWQGPHSRFPDYTTLMIRSWRDQFFESCLNDPKRNKTHDKKNTRVCFTDAGAQTWEEPSFIPLDGDLIQRREMPRWKMIEIRTESARLFDGQVLPRPSYTLARRKYVSGNDTSIPSYT